MIASARLGGLRTLVCLSVLSLLLLGGGLQFLAERVDRESIAHETRFIDADWQQIIDDNVTVVDSNAQWDALVGKTSPVIDASWLDNNLGTSSPGTQAGGYLVIVDPLDHLAYARFRDHPIPARVQADVAIAIAPAIRKLRVRETDVVASRQRGIPLTGPEDDQIHYGSVILLNNEIYVFFASRIDSPSSAKIRLRPRAAILAVLEPIGDSVLPNLIQHLDLRDPRLFASWPPPVWPAIALHDPLGRKVAALSWIPHRPGTELVHEALPVLVLVIGVLGTCTFLAYGRTARDAQALAASEGRALHIAYHDQLTELPNRRLMRDRLAEAVLRVGRENEGLALIMLDLDRFKAVNDTYGHGAGDELIQHVARRIRRLCRPGDVCARLGGDEFLVLLEPADAKEAAEFAGRVTAALAEPVPLSAATVQVGASAGVTLYAGGDIDPDELLRQADLALYQTKEKEPGSWSFFVGEMDAALRDRREFERDLRRALSNGEIRVFYQPQFRNGRLFGVEALARWTHPVRGSIPPSLFVSVAEECGLIDELGCIVIARAFLDARRWPSLRVAINVSGSQIMSRHFLPRLRALVTDLSADPRRVDIELTETVLLRNDRRVHEALLVLRHMGFAVVLDDFGTGYASLSYLRSFPIDKIKIDRSFILPLPSDSIAEGLVRTIIRLGEVLNLGVLAEGVETEEQRRRLAAMGCHDIQGYLVGTPLPPERIDQLQHQTLAA